MKKMMLGAIAGAMVFASACTSQNSATEVPEETEVAATEEAVETNITDGVYTAKARGNNADIEVQVTVEGGAIQNVEVLSHSESKGISVAPLAELPEKIVKYQTVNVDGLSGSTMTSTGLKNAVKDCLTQAEASDEFFAEAQEEYAAVEDVDCDVVVIGSGAAGMTSAIHAAQNGANVIIVEKQDILGGTSLLSNSMFGSVGTSVHQAEGLTETVDDLIENYLKPEAATGGYIANEEAATILATNSATQAEYLISLGVELDHTSSKFILAPKGGSGLGSMVIPALTEEMEKAGVDIRKSTKAEHINVEDGKVTGIEVTSPAGTYTIRAKAVIVATGGYAAGRDMVAKYLPEWSSSIYYCSPGDTGDGLVMAEEIGVELVDLEIMKANPLVFYDYTKALTMNAAVGAGAIMVNHEGERFANEQGGYGISPSINNQTNGEGIVLFDNTLIEENETIKGYYENGYLTEADSLEELAEKLDVDTETLINTVSEYQTMAENGEDTLFGRKTVADLYSGDKFYGIIVKPSIQGTFGGIPTNTDAEVLNGDGTVFTGLYAVGECAQEGVNGLNPMTTNMVFGTIAGENAATFALSE